MCALIEVYYSTHIKQEAREIKARERVYAAVNFREPDRVPICFGGSTQATMLECPPDGKICSQLYRHLGLKDAEPVQIAPWLNIVTNLDERVMQRLHSDIRNILPNPPPPIIEPDGTKTWRFFL